MSHYGDIFFFYSFFRISTYWLADMASDDFDIVIEAMLEAPYKNQEREVSLRSDIKKKQTFFYFFLG